MYFPWFQYGCVLEINAQRTAAYLENLSDVCLEGEFPGSHSMTCDCPPLYWSIPDDGTPGVAATYTNPITDQAPWYDASIPESGQFLGFLVGDVVQNAVSSRSVTTRISSSGGGVLGPLRSKERRYDFTVLMFACNELAMEYGFRFLTDALGSGGCDDGCTLCDAEFRDSCPTVDGNSLVQLNKGRWILKNVGLVDGPIWDEPPVEGMQCNIRRVKFSLVSEYAWKFKCPVIECEDVELAGYPADGADCVNTSDIYCEQQEVSCSVSEGLIIGETGLIIEVQAGTVPLQHIEIAVRPDKFGYECNVGSRPAGYVRVDPCDLIYIPYLPESTKLVYDTAIETVSVEYPGGGLVDGSSFIATAEGRPPTWPTLRCGDFCVSVSVSECAVIGTPTVTISSVHREI